MTTADRCVSHVTALAGWHLNRCKRKSGHGPGGAYCKYHDPDAGAAKATARDAKWRAKSAAADIARDEFALACIAYVRNVATIHNDEDARRIVAEYEGKLK